jgi:16S rRNA G527 N7-methylase RsmG
VTFHVKQLQEAFIKSVREWDRVHRLIGKEDPQRLYAQAREALKFHLKAGEPSKTLVDIGAGSGLLGFAWLELDPSHRVVFVEPRKKAHSFLHHFVASGYPGLSARSKVLGEGIEAVSRETLVTFAGGDFFGVARAFSGARSLEEFIAQSQLKQDRIYVFSAPVAESKNPQYRLRQINGSQSTRG